MKKTERRIFGSAAVLGILFVILFWAPVPAQAEKYAYSVTPKVNRAAIAYMTEMYIQDHPEMGKEICYGSPSDIEVLRELAKTITSGVSGKKKQAEAIAKWVKRNIQYESFSQYQYPFDVLCARKSNCYGDAYLMQHLMRLSGIPAVVCAGLRGNMKSVLKVSWLDPDHRPDDIVGHAWVYAWYSGKWHLFDPLFDVYDWTKAEEIDAWYCNSNIEGIAPSYSGMDMKLFSEQWCLYWVDGRPILYSEGKPFSEAMNGVRDKQWGETSAQYFSGINDFHFPAFYHSGFTYLKNDSARKAKMIPDEVLSDGWIFYDGYPQYVRANGIVVTNTMRQYQGEWLYLTASGSSLKCSLPIGEISLREGVIELPVGKSMTLYPGTWEDMNREDKFYYWYTDYTDQVDVDPDLGTIKGKSPGYAVVDGIQYSHEQDGMSESERTSWGFASAFVWVVSERRSYSLKDSGEPEESGQKTLISLTGAAVKVADCTFSGKAKKPEPRVSLDGKALKKGRDYTVSYKNNIQVGKATAVITGIGDYTGTVKKTFSVLPKKTSLKKLKGGKKKITVRWKKGPKGIGGYQLQYSADRKFRKAKTVTVRKAKTTSYTIRKLKAKKTYYVRIRTWKKVSGKKYYSGWSKAKKKKTS